MKNRDYKNNNSILRNVGIILVVIFLVIPLLTFLFGESDRDRFESYYDELQFISEQVKYLSGEDFSDVQTGIYSPLEVIYKLDGHEERVDEIENELNHTISDGTYRALTRTHIIIARTNLLIAKSSAFRVAVIGTNPTEEMSLAYRDWIWGLEKGEFEQHYEYYKRNGKLNLEVVGK